MGSSRNGVGTGIVLITIGLIFFAERQGYGSFGNLWPLILIVSGLGKMLFPYDRSVVFVAGRRGCRRDSRYSGVWLTLVGVLFLLHQNHIMRINQTWPLFIVAGGLGIIFSGVFRHSGNDANPGDPSIGQGGQ